MSLRAQTRDVKYPVNAVYSVICAYTAWGRQETRAQVEGSDWRQIGTSAIYQLVTLIGRSRFTTSFYGTDEICCLIL